MFLFYLETCLSLKGTGHILYHFGASLAELGYTLSMASLIEDQKEKEKLLSKFTDWWETGNEI